MHGVCEPEAWHGCSGGKNMHEGMRTLLLSMSCSKNCLSLSQAARCSSSRPTGGSMPCAKHLISLHSSGICMHLRQAKMEQVAQARQLFPQATGLHESLPMTAGCLLMPAANIL